MSRPTAHRLVLPVVAFTVLATYVGNGVAIPLIQPVQHQTGVSLATATWILTAPFLAGVVATPLLGRFGDVHGKRVALLISLALAAVGGFLAAATSWFPLTVMGRGLVGVAAAALPLGMAIVRDTAPPAKVRTSVGHVSAMANVGGSFGLVVGALLGPVVGYRGAFAIPAGVATVALFMVAVAVPESRTRRPVRFDVPGALGLGSWLACLLLPISEGQAWGWLSPVTVGLFAVAVAGAAVWVRYERGVQEPLFNPRLLSTAPLLIANVGLFFGGTATYLVFLGATQFVQTPAGDGFGFTAVGVRLIPYMLAYSVGGLVARYLASALLRGVQLSVLYIASNAAAALSCVFFIGLHSEPWQVFTATAAAGVSLGVQNFLSPVLIVERAPESETSLLLALNTIMRTVGQAVGGAMAGALLEAGGVLGDGSPALRGYLLVFALAAALMVVTGAFVRNVRGRALRRAAIRIDTVSEVVNA